MANPPLCGTRGPIGARCSVLQQHQAGEGVESDTRSRANQPMLAVISNLLQSMLAQVGNLLTAVPVDAL